MDYVLVWFALTILPIASAQDFAGFQNNSLSSRIGELTSSLRYFSLHRQKDQGRPLTAGEHKLAFPIFGATIDYSKVRVVDGLPASQEKRYSVLAVTVGNIIYLRADDGLLVEYKGDISALNVRLQGHFIHELTHVYQYQRLGTARMNVNNALELYFPENKDCNRYCFVLDLSRSFYSYGIEQQAMLVQGYFLAQHGQPPALYPNIIPTSASPKVDFTDWNATCAAFLPLYRTALSGFLKDPRRGSSQP